MSDSVKCDNCESRGRRKIGKIAPNEWFYAETKMDDTCYTYACSEGCCKINWNKGPGKLDLDDD